MQGGTTTGVPPGWLAALARVATKRSSRPMDETRVAGARWGGGEGGGEQKPGWAEWGAGSGGWGIPPVAG